MPSIPPTAPATLESPPPASDTTPLVDAAPAAPRNTARNRPIEGLRGLCATLVVVAHIVAMSVKGGFCPLALGPLAPFFHGAGIGSVTLFFLISGYLIVQSLVRHQDVRAFLVNRVLRIYPVFVPLHLLIFLAGPPLRYEWMGALRHHPGALALSFLENLLFLPGTLPLPIAQRNAWSLSYEWAFYLLAALLFLSFRSSRKATHKAGALAPTRPILFTGAAALSVAYIWWHPLAAFFPVGAAVYRWESRLSQLRPPVLVREAGIPLLFLTLLLVERNVPAALLCGGVAFASIVFGWGLLAQFLKTRPLQYLGRISYSLYLIHPFGFAAAREIVKRFGAHAGRGEAGDLLTFASFAIVGGALSLLLSNLSYRYVEVAFTDRFRRRKRRRGEVEATAARRHAAADAQTQPG